MTNRRIEMNTTAARIIAILASLFGDEERRTTLSLQTHKNKTAGLYVVGSRIDLEDADLPKSI